MVKPTLNVLEACSRLAPSGGAEREQKNRGMKVSKFRRRVRKWDTLMEREQTVVIFLCFFLQFLGVPLLLHLITKVEIESKTIEKVWKIYRRNENENV